jgi:hypothetical protein
MDEVLMAMGVMALVCMVATGVAATVVVRRVRRRYRSARARIVAFRASQPDVHHVVRASSSYAVATVGSPGWWAAQNQRHRMWKAVSSAEHAVNVARRADVAVGDLPALARRLNAAATGLDATLRASGREGSVRAEDRSDCDRIVAAAHELRTAAMSSLRSESHADTDTVVSAVQLEVAALAAGLRAAHS